jgi:VanZ family protein
MADKAAHFIMYAGLGLLLARAMHNPPRTTWIREAVAAVLLVAAIGAADEWHQQYIQGRSTEFADWMADTGGGFAGAFVWVALSRAKSRRNT